MLRKKKCFRNENLQEIRLLHVSHSGEGLTRVGIKEMIDRQLDYFVVQFMAEVEKENGHEYPRKTLYEMISSNVLKGGV